MRNTCTTFAPILARLRPTKQLSSPQGSKLSAARLIYRSTPEASPREAPTHVHTTRGGVHCVWATGSATITAPNFPAIETSGFAAQRCHWNTEQTSAGTTSTTATTSYHRKTPSKATPLQPLQRRLGVRATMTPAGEPTCENHYGKASGPHPRQRPRTHVPRPAPTCTTCSRRAYIGTVHV